MSGGEVENTKIIPGRSADEQMPQRAAEPVRREAAGFHALAFIAWGVAVYAVLKHGRYRAELLAAVLVLFALTTLFNLVYLLYARLLRIPAEEFAVGLGGGVGKFRVGRTLVRFGLMPQGGY